MRLFHGKLVFTGFIVILFFVGFFLPAKKVIYAQNSSKEIIVVFKNKPTISALSTLSNNTTQELEFQKGITATNAIVFSVPSGDTQTAMLELSADPNVAGVFPNHQMHLLTIPNDPLATSATPRSQWNLYNVKLAGSGTTAWDVTTGSADVVVATIDTGVDSAHPDLSGKIASMADCSTGSCAAVSSMTDTSAAGHGTHVAGIIGAATNNGLGVAGVGYKTKVMPIKVMKTDGSTDTSDFLNSIAWAADHGAKVINISMGIIADDISQTEINTINSSIAYAWGKGAIVVAAAGNCRGNTDGRKDCAIFASGDSSTVLGYAQNPKMYPAASSNVISVAATLTDNSIAAYSEVNDSSNSNIGNWISVAAPGGDGNCSDATKSCILSTVPTNQYFWQAGTSMAAPHVSGIAALVWAANPVLTNVQVKSIIESSANHAIASGVTNFGLVDALAAVQAAGGTTTSPTPSPTGNPSGTPVPTATGGLTPTGNLTPTASATISTTPTITPTAGPTATPTVTPYPTTAPKLPKATPNPYPAAPYCPALTSCTLKTKGDANCDGVINLADFNLWLQQFDTMISASPANQNSNFACVEGNTLTYFADLADFEVWRRNTTGGFLVAPVASGPSVTPSGGQQGANCTSTANCLTGLCCVSGTNLCQSTTIAGINCLAGSAGTQVTPTVTPRPGQNTPNQPGGGGTGGAVGVGGREEGGREGGRTTTGTTTTDNQGNKTYTDNQGNTTWTSADGRTTVFTSADGKTTTTTVTDENGKTTATSTVVTDENGNIVSSSTTDPHGTTTTDNHGTTTTDNQGNKTYTDNQGNTIWTSADGKTTVSTSADGKTTTTTVNNSDGTTTSQTVVTEEEPPENGNPPGGGSNCDASGQNCMD